jgi:hypothetical protein
MAESLDDLVSELPAEYPQHFGKAADEENLEDEEHAGLSEPQQKRKRDSKEKEKATKRRNRGTRDLIDPGV